MPPQKPLGNGYYGYGEVANSSTSQVETEVVDDTINTTPDDEGSPTDDNVFAEYLWMENEEEFDKQVLQQLEEEELMEQCLEAMLADEEEDGNNLMVDSVFVNSALNSEALGDQDVADLAENFKLTLIDVEQSTLNPLAAEFVPDPSTAARVYSTTTE